MHTYGMHKQKRLVDAYGFKGFEPNEEVIGIFGDPQARVIRLNRREKKQSVLSAVVRTKAFTTERFAEFATSPVEIHASIWRWRSAASTVGVVRK